MFRIVGENIKLMIETSDRKEARKEYSTHTA
jgi:hypothetical protein